MYVRYCAAALLLIAGCGENNASSQSAADTAPIAATSYANSNPAWSPDGRKIGFVSDRDGDTEIYIADLETGELSKITDNAVQDYGPAWSPEGQRLAFYRGEDATFEIYVLNLADESVLQMTDFGAYTGNPAFSPDGESIAITSNKDGVSHEVYVTDLASDDVAQLTHNEYRDFTPVWSPDGASIAFASDRAGEGQWDIYVMNADGSGQRLLGGANDNDYYPEWSPDGKRIAFFSGPGFDSFDLYMLDVETGEATQITHGMGSGKPSWSPDGSKIAFGADHPDGARIYIAGVRGENPEPMDPQ